MQLVFETVSSYNKIKLCTMLFNNIEENLLQILFKVINNER